MGLSWYISSSTCSTRPDTSSLAKNLHAGLHAASGPPPAGVTIQAKQSNIPASCHRKEQQLLEPRDVQQSTAPQFTDSYKSGADLEAFETIRRTDARLVLLQLAFQGMLSESNNGNRDLRRGCLAKSL